MRAATTSLQLLGSFQLSVGAQIAHLPLQAQRLLAYLAVNEHPVARQPLAETLWPFARQARAQANLRTALWRVRHEAPESIDVEYEVVELAPNVDVDYRDLFNDESWLDVEAHDDGQVIAQLRSELLPGWDEEWLMIERERARQLRMRRLEALSGKYLTSGNVAAAIDAAFASIEIEPLRETAHLALIEAHVEDGNLAEAAHQAARLTDLVDKELGISPSAQFQDRLAEMGVATNASG